MRLEYININRFLLHCFFVFCFLFFLFLLVDFSIDIFGLFVYGFIKIKRHMYLQSNEDICVFVYLLGKLFSFRQV